MGRTTPISTSLLKNSGTRPWTTLPVRRHCARLDQAMTVHAVVHGLVADLAHALDLVRLRRRDEVVEQGGSAGEALHPEQLLGVERAVGRAVLRVALVRDVASAYVEHRAEF